MLAIQTDKNTTLKNDFGFLEVWNVTIRVAMRILDGLKLGTTISNFG